MCPTVNPIGVMDFDGLAHYYAKKHYKRIKAAGVSCNGLEDDLLQAGREGLLQAWERYDPKKGATFATFAVNRINGQILDYLRRLDPLKQETRENIKALDAVEAKFFKEHGRKPSSEELAHWLGKTVKVVEKIQTSRVDLFSLNSLTASNEDSDQQSLQIASGLPTPEEKVLRDSLGPDVRNCLQSALEKEERQVLFSRVLNELTLDKTCRLLGFSISTADRREKTAKAKMKLCLEGKGWMVTDLVFMGM